MEKTIQIPNYCWYIPTLSTERDDERPYLLFLKNNNVKEMLYSVA